MGFYGKRVLPWLIDVTMRNPETARLRAASIPRARGDVLEVGIGSGLNLPLYSSEVKRVCGVDASPELLRLARERAAGLALKVEVHLQSAEEPLPLAEASVDTAVVTWSLCSIADPHKALQQMRRVLKPGGELIFIEHGQSADPGVATWQDRLTPLWKKLAGGCHLNRRIDALISEAGFHITDLETKYMPGPRPMTYTYQGVARVG